ncbi:MAG: hypothetical protein AD073_000260 [Mycoplasmataceae bacterium]|nr:MAG: hypothetical protein AD073_000260 [Mycoplasmataceae bacterium]
MLKTFKFRFYPNKDQQNKIDQENEKCKNSISKWIKFITPLSILIAQIDLNLKTIY